MYDILYSHTKATWRKENIIMKTIKRENTCTVLYICIFKNPHRSGVTQFKPVLFAGQLYI